MSEFSIKPSFIGKLLGRNCQFGVYSNCISINRKNSGEEVIKISELIDFVIVTKGIFGAKISLRTSSRTILVTLLHKQQTHFVAKYINSAVSKILSEKIADSMKVFVKYAVNEYLRDSSISKINTVVLPILSSYEKSKDVWRSNLSDLNNQLLSALSENMPLEGSAGKFRESYEQRILSERQKFFDSAESHPLTNQQRLAVIRNNDRNLVLAAAGTGKTSVIVAKAIDLVDSGAAKADEILVLAYNSAAAKELRERFTSRSKQFGIDEENGPSIFTFHALGLRVLKEAKIPTYLSVFVEDPIKVQMWVSQWLVDYVQASEKSLANIIQLSYQPINPFDFKTKQEYDTYVRDNEYRTLRGDRVRGYQELLIANWFFMNCVDAEYEAPFVNKRRIEIGFDYKPDFHIKETNIYLEHFGIDRNGNTRPDIDKGQYNTSIRSKRELHKECGTVLLETYHFDWTEDNLESRLSELMASVNVITRKRPPEEIFLALKDQGFLEENSKRYLKCLQAIRAEQLNRASILSRLKENNIVYAQKYTDLLVSIHDDYVSELKRQKCIDFDDMIIRASQAVDAGTVKPKWTHILVDEFQDISMARMNLLKTLIKNGTNPILTVVGDDWQSIYRFNGGKLELTTRFEDLVGSCTTTKLEKTFRYNNSIAKTAGMFVMQNPEQYTKQVITHDQVNSSHVFLLDSLVENKSNIEERTVQAIGEIRKKDPKGSIAILARYQYLLKNTKEIVNRHRELSANLRYWTFHGSKGLEADHCILIGFFQGKVGFPNKNKEEAVIESLLPSLDTFPHSEERRLLYVALTRARKSSYIIADPMAPSEFVNELLSPKYELQINSKSFADRHRKMFKCPICTEGYFRLFHGKYGDFYSCTSGSICNSKPRVCDKCGAPSIDSRSKSVCNNQDCRDEKLICEQCGRPMRLRNGKYGQFWGCSGYGIKHDQCKQTRKYVG